MRKKHSARPLIYLVASLFAVCELAGCTVGGENSSDVQKDKTYNISFVNYDNTILYETKTLEGAMPQYSGLAPKRTADAQYTYRFAGWDPILYPADKDQVYTAKYTTSVNTYTVTIDDQAPFSVEYGSKIQEPVHPEDYLLGDFFYSFDGWQIEGTTVLWNFETDVVTKDIVLKSHFVKTTAINVKFLNYDGSVLDEHKSGKGVVPTYKGQTPTKPMTKEKEYTWSGWDKELVAIEEDTTYTAQYTEAPRKYDIKFYNYDGSLITTIPTEYGVVPSYTGETPQKQSDNVYGYTFEGWTPELAPVTGAASYTAVYSKYPLDPVTVTINQYIDDNATPVYTDQVTVANHTTYTVDSKYHQILGEGYNPSHYSMKSSDIVDIYLIAGQSNAAGYSHINYLSSGKKEQYPATPHVTFYGTIDSRVVSDITTPVTFGLGASANHFGAEVGMAKIIENSNPNGISTIVKTAFGGSWLYDYRGDDVSRNFGNWCSPSMRGNNPDPNITGRAYDTFINDVTTATKYYKDNGYMVRLNGMLWIQGEQESSQANSADYGIHLEALINDLRDDFTDLFDYNATTAPFIIGKISSTFAGGHLGVDNVRNCEEQVAAKMDDVYALETYEICDPVTKEPKTGCYDKYHFSADDMLEIGERTATLMGEKIVPEGTDDAVNVLRKEINGNTTFDLYFETRTGASYKIEYYFDDGEDYVKSNYSKTITSTDENPFYPGDKVTASTEIPLDITDTPTLPDGFKWVYNSDKSLNTGFVVSGGKLTLKLYYDAVNPIDVNNTIKFDESYWKGQGLSGQAGNFSQKSSTGETYNFTTNQWIEYTPDGWGSWVTNGAHWDSYIQNTTAIKGIKEIKIQIWWNIFNYEENSVPYIGITTAYDSSFSNGSNKVHLRKGDGNAASQGEVFTIKTEGLPTFFKIDFGDSSTNTFFDTIMNLTITYCDVTKDNYLNHNVNVVDGNQYTASKFDGTGWSNFDGAYCYKGIYSDAIIASIDMTFIDHDFRAYSGITFSTGEKVDTTLADNVPYNFRSIQFGLAFNGVFSALNHKGTSGADSSNYYPAINPKLGTTAKLTVVLYQNQFAVYVNDVLIARHSITEKYQGAFENGSQFMLGFWFANYFNATRKITVLSEIYGSENVLAEINSNSVFEGLR